MQGILAIIRKDFKSLSKSVGRLLYLFVAPLLLVFLASIALPGGSSSSDKPLFKVPVVVLDEGSSAKQLVEALNKVTSVTWETAYAKSKTEQVPMTQAQAEELLSKRKAYLVIPEHYSQDLAEQKPVQLQVIRDPSDQTVAMMVQQVLNAITAPESTARIGQTVIETAARVNGSLSPASVQAAQSVLQDKIANPPLNVVMKAAASQAEEKQPSAFEIYVPGFAVMFMLFGATSAAGSLLTDRKEGIIGRLRSMPISMSQVMVGKMLSNFLLMMMQMAVLFTGAKLLFGLSFGHDLPALVLMIIGTSCAATGLGLLIASFATSFEQVTSMMPIVILSMSALGGSWWPLYMEPELVQKIARVTVNAWSTEGFHQLLIYGKSLGDVWLNITVLLGMGLLFLGVASWNFRKKL
jgi:ABC-2 type transport system permease protein